MKRLVLFTSIILTICTTTFSQYDAELGAQLKSGDVQNFIKVYPSLVKDFESLNIKYENNNNVFSFLEGEKYHSEIQRTLDKHGYSDVNDFIIKASAIAHSYASIRMNTEYEKNKDEIDQAIKEIDNNPSFTDEQKQQMKAAMQMLQSGNIGAQTEDIKVVKPYIKQLDKIFDNE